MSGFEMKNLEKEDISNKTISFLLKGRANIIPYHSIPLKPNFLSWFTKNNSTVPLIILYEQFRNVGHFVVLQLKEKYIEYFDPLAFPVDGILKFWNKEIDHYLTKGLESTGLPIVSSKRPVQRFDLDTCGRHCVARVMYNSTYSILQDYIDFLLSQPNPDDFVTRLTET